VTKLISTIALVILGLVALGAVGPKLAPVIAALVPLVLVVGVVVAVLRMTWWYTRR
jgi:uncharacterized membrane protein YdjX (TVP38/TMEM64 family)